MRDRVPERGRIERLLKGARDGQAGSLLLVGEPGIGKTTLLDHAVAHATGMRHLHARGVEQESDLPYAGLHELLRPVLDHIDGLTANQAEALRRALALGEGSAADRFAAYAATLALIAAVADDEPLLCTVDDLQWLDSESRGALLFTARRLEAERAALLFAARNDEPADDLAPGIPVLEVGPLDAVTAREILEDAGMHANAETAERLCRETGGNALALVTLPPAAPGDASPLPIADRVREAFAARVEPLPPATKRTLLVAAALEDGDPAIVARALARSGHELSALEPAEDADLVRLEGGRILFRHPLVRAAIYQSAPIAERREIHAALAEELQAAGEADRAAWQLAAAASGPDEAVAAALEEAAGRARARGGLAAEAKALETSALLTPDAEQRAGRLLAAARAIFITGRSERALELADQAASVGAEGPGYGVALMRARIALWHGARLDADTLAERAERAAADGDVPSAIGFYVVALQASRVALDFGRALELAGRASELAGRQSLMLEGILASAQVLVGESAEGSEATRRIAEAAVASGDSETMINAAETLTWIDDHDAARRLFDRALAERRELGGLHQVAYYAGLFGMLDARLGHLHAAEALVDEASRIADEVALVHVEAMLLAVRAVVAALRGDEERCRASAARAIDEGRRHAGVETAAVSQHALGLLELSLGRPEEAAAQLEPVVRARREGGIREPGFLRVTADHVEALIRAGREADAREALAAAREEAEATGRRSALAALARCEGMLAPDDAFDEPFALSLAEFEALGMALDVARTQLCYGERLRRTRRRVDARVYLRQAIDGFSWAGAERWAERAATELRASGETAVRRPDPSAAEQLTPQELQVAHAVATGATNREVGAQLFLSPKTIEAHLSRIYRKLGLRSRTELIRRLAEGEALAAT